MIVSNVPQAKPASLARQITAANKSVFSRKRIRHYVILFLIISLTFYVYIYYKNNKNMFIKFNILRDNYIARTLIVGFEEENNKTDNSQSGNEVIRKVENVIVKNKLSDGRCNPILSSDKLQYKVKIGGVEYPQHVPIHFNRSVDFECLNNNSLSKRMPVILFWNKFYGDESFYFSLGKKTPFVNNGCPAVNCETTSDKSRLSEADLVVVSMPDGIPGIPNNRPLNQRWVFTVIESPVHTRDYVEYNGVFNLSATYVNEADFSNSYEYQGNYYWKKNDSFDENQDFHGEKLGKAAALISNCGAGTRRLEYVSELNKFISVKLYGACGEGCPSTSRITNKPANCKEIIGTEYKFFLAFENSYCKDYITEKFFHMLSYNIIPVVLGGGNYSQFMPKSGFIDVFDYDSPKKLGEYLNYLDQNKTAYNSYFKWKKHIWFHNIKSTYTSICSMCIKLQLEEYTGVKKHIVHDIHEIWDRKMCKSPNMQRKNDILYYSV